MHIEACKNNAILIDDKKPIECEFCEATFPNRRYSRDHFIRFHHLKSFYKCATCDRRFIRRQEFLCHIENCAEENNGPIMSVNNGIDGGLDFILSFL